MLHFVRTPSCVLSYIICRNVDSDRVSCENVYGIQICCGKFIWSIDVSYTHLITHDLIGKFGSASVLLKKAPDGTGVIAGGPARAVIELAGIKNIRTKSLGSNNKQNVVLATIEGLSQIKTPEEVAKLRGKSVEEILG